MPTPLLRHFFDAASCTFTQLIACPRTGRAAVSDPVLDCDAKAARTSTENAERLLAQIDVARLSVEWILETHVHADHVSAAQFLQSRRGGRIGIGAEVRGVQRAFVELFGLRDRVATDGSQFDHLFRDGERFALGGLDVQVLATPGHTSDSVTYVIGRHAFVGDTVFRSSYGTARCDFPGGDAARLFDSVGKILALPADTVLHFCHDYPPAGHEPVESQTVAEERARNVQLSATTSREQFVAMRRARDATLTMPAMLIPAVQINIAAGRLPAAESNGFSYLKLPLNVI
jgi:glyoxylase-like metal-dependent hydrolase (beta-lactamase superfamily II)